MFGIQLFASIFIIGSLVFHVEAVCPSGDTITKVFVDAQWPEAATQRIEINGCTAVTAFEEGAFDAITGLTHLNLKGNKIAKVEKDAFENVPSLIEIDLSDNNISVVDPGAFSELTNLKTLNLHGNNIAAIENKVFKDLTALTSLDLGQNKISEIKNGTFLTYLTNLDSLDLSDNQITSIEDGAFAGLTKLKTLHLQRNQISALTNEMFTGLDILNSLYLSNNNIMSLSENMRGITIRVALLDLSNNPLHCNCSMSWLATLYNTESATRDSIALLHCATPVSGKFLDNLSGSCFPVLASTTPKGTSGATTASVPASVLIAGLIGHFILGL